MAALTHDDGLGDFERRGIELSGVGKSVYVSGSGPAVIVIHEMPGISPHVARFARWLRDAGFTIFMPSLFGRDGAIGTVEEAETVFRGACISAEFRTLAGQGSSPVTAWLRALAKQAHEECGGRGVGAVGMCFTGNFALSMMLEPAVLAPVLAQPVLPMDDPAAIESPAEETDLVRARLEREDLTVLGYRFEGDAFCRAERFATYRRALGERFVGRVLPDEAANKDLPPFFQKHVPTPHSVVTVHLRDAEGEPTVAARDEIIAFMKLRLLADRQPQ
jgi:dienelactone hydrolase